MSVSLATLLNLEIAWKRLKLDVKDRIFVTLPNEIEIIETDLNKWLSSIKNSIIDDNYHPQTAQVCDVPKKGGTIRPAIYLNLTDRTVYTACIGACFEKILEEVNWTTEIIDYSLPLSNNLKKTDWIENQFNLWRSFSEESLKVLDSGMQYAVIADITGFYENIDISTLISDLKRINAPKEVVDQISLCLNRWAITNGRGIPQGYSASDILAKLYLTTVDKWLGALGYTHFRYNDDIRIFCRTKIEAKKALADLVIALRRRGLNIHTSKTGIFRADLAKIEIEGVQPIIDKVKQQFINEVIENMPFGDPYLNIFEAEEISSGGSIDEPIEVIRDTFKAYFVEDGDKNFDKTLFRYLLKRLSKKKDKFAVGFCKDAIIDHPEETLSILRYIKAVNALTDFEDTIISFLHSENAIYAYQIYLMIDWYLNTGCQPKIELVDSIRRILFDINEPLYVKSVAREFLGRFGSSTDLEFLESSYASCGIPEQIEIICALKRQEKNRRNAFYARAEHDSPLHKYAVNYVKTLKDS